MHKVLRNIRTRVLLIGLLLGFTGAIIALPASTSAIDIFNNCSKTSATLAQKTDCRDCSDPVASQTDYCKDAAAQTGNPIIHIITVIINIISYIAGAAAIISLIVCGLRLMLSNGDSNAVTTARNGIVYALIGIGVIVFAQVIVVFVLNKVK